MVKTAILITSDSRGSVKKPDMVVPAIKEFFSDKCFEIVESKIVRDDVVEIKNAVTAFADDDGIDLILTAGGTGVTPRDVTPEAVKPLLTMEIPGIPEAMRAYSFQKTARAIISRAVAGLIGHTLVINLPGSPKAAVENLEPVYDAFSHIIKKAKGSKEECAG